MHEEQVGLLKIVALSSGGVDSTVLVFLMKKEGHDVHPVHINYGQLAEEREWTASQSVCKHLAVRGPVKIDVSGVRIIPSGLTDRNLDIEKYAFLPTRNLLFITLGAAYAYSILADAVAIGILANPIFPDQTPEFIRSAESCINRALGRRIRILAPFISLDKRETLKLAEKYGLPIESTYYCHSGGKDPCGICISCKERIAAEKSLRTTANENDSPSVSQESVDKRKDSTGA